MDDQIESDHDIRRTLRIKKHADGLIPAAAERSVRFIAWVAAGCFMSIASIVTGTIFVIKITSSVADLQGRTGKIEGWKDATVTTLTAMQASISGNSAEIGKRTESIKHAEKMWTQREMGVSNKEVFYIDHGYAPPSINAAQPRGVSPSPTPPDTNE